MGIIDAIGGGLMIFATVGMTVFLVGFLVCAALALIFGICGG